MKQVTFTADDFGLSESVNQAVEIAHRHGVLTAASLMVSGAAVDDAVRRARTMPNLRVGLHLVVIEGQATLPSAQIPDLVDDTGWFGSDQFRRSVSYFCRRGVRQQLAAEIEAQFAAFAATGLPLGHADAHKHMHLHPTIGRMLIDTGRHYGLLRVRVPAEPPAVMRACGERVGPGAWALHAWTRVLRRQVVRAGMRTDDQVFGIAWSGHMTTARLQLLLERLPDGSSEIYTHPALRQDATLRRLMPHYDPAGELAGLCDGRVAALYNTHLPAVAEPF